MGAIKWPHLVWNFATRWRHHHKCHYHLALCAACLPHNIFAGLHQLSISGLCITVSCIRVGAGVCHRCRRALQQPTYFWGLNNFCLCICLCNLCICILELSAFRKYGLCWVFYALCLCLQHNVQNEGWGWLFEQC